MCLPGRALGVLLARVDSQDRAPARNMAPEATKAREQPRVSASFAFDTGPKLPATRA